MRRPSPALVIALLALAGSWGGPAVAAQLIGSKQVKDNSLTARDVKDRSLRGRDMRSNTLTGRTIKGLSSRDIVREGLDGSVIDEPSLSEVPRAATAGRADAATTADAVKGARIVRIAYAQLTGGETSTVLDEGGLAIRARCAAPGTLTVDTTAGGGGSGGVVHVTATAGGANSTTTAASSDNDLRAGDALDVIPAGASHATGTLSWYSPAGDTITLDYLAQDGLGAARGYQCLFTGTAVHATP
jgi:hypothetical protein